ncbi:hypothetical protein [Enterobacter sp.]|uniref:hypothetical protein n=1 Tax=Enterobacter sp. TaxID=42895 RepID=UPI00296F93E0|nr:hypothetical protein [Enterobacter sp.]
MDTENRAITDTKRIKARSIYRLLLIGLSIPMAVLGFIFGLFACFGYDTVSWNQQYIHGVLALPVGLLIGILMSAVMTAMIGSLSCLGLWIYSRFRPLRIAVLD